MPHFDSSLELVFEPILEPIFEPFFNAIELGPWILWAEVHYL